MKFVLEVNLPEDSDVNGELAGILSDLAGEMNDLTELEPGDKQDIHDSSHARVGSWHVTVDAE
ncbi:hypothetical protein [Mycolicibacterium baixiangningiae]|uniref:hypothetical protein n=1 Tax=Mycolicibacterium baixiangningiae TaxID=2761578 RepID=UPI0018D1507C|nr:hypothetical protein [Mycolicibacterium baixiangningiae]